MDSLPVAHELRADRGSGRLSEVTEREVAELKEPSHPRKEVGPMAELELSDELVSLAAEDEKHRCAPVAHSAADPDEPACDENGVFRDIQRDTPIVDDFADLELPEVAVGDGDLL